MQMDTLKPQKGKTRKTKVVTRKSTAQILWSLFFRTIEITVFVVTVIKLFNQLVITYENYVHDFNGLPAILSNRHFAFFIGNAVVIALLARSDQFPNQEHDPRRTSNDLYEEFVQESKVREETRNRVKGTSTRQSISAKNQRQTMNAKDGVTERRPRQNIGENTTKQMKSYVRSRSENGKISRRKLRRSETDWFLDSYGSEEKTSDLNDDELRHKIESFIARQRRNQTDEEFCIM